MSDFKQAFDGISDVLINEKLAQCKSCGGDAEIKKIDGDWVAQCKQCNNEFYGSDYKPWTVENWNKQNESISDYDVKLKAILGEAVPEEEGGFFRVEFSQMKDLAKKRLGVKPADKLGPALVVKYKTMAEAEEFLFGLMHELEDKAFKTYSEVEGIDKNQMYDFLYSYYSEDGTPLPESGYKDEDKGWSKEPGYKAHRKYRDDSGYKADKDWSSESVSEKVVKLPNGKWQVQSEKGRNMGVYSTEEEAKKRLQDIEYFKHKKG